MHDYDNLRYIGNGKIIKLSEKENELLKILIENKGRVVSKDFLLKILYEDILSNRALLRLINRLRKKLKNEVVIKNKQCVGYMI